MPCWLKLKGKTTGYLITVFNDLGLPVLLYESL